MKFFENTRIYRVNHTIEVKEREEIKKSSLQYDLGIACSDKETSIRRIFTKEKMLLNSAPPKQHHVALIFDLEEAVFPLEIEFSNWGNFQKIPAYSLWLNYWKAKVKNILETKYKGDFSENLKNQFQEAIDTEEKLKQKMQDEALWRSYFFNMREIASNKQFRWTLLKGGTIYFGGGIEIDVNSNKKTSKYQGKLINLDQSIVNNINQLLRRKKYTQQYLLPDTIMGDCIIENTAERETGLLLNKKTELSVYSTNTKDYNYKEEIEIQYHSISMRKIESPLKFSFTDLENKK